MKMNWSFNTSFMCEECVEYLLKNFTDTHVFEWGLTCQYFSDRKIREVFTATLKENVIQELEQLGYVVSTESKMDWIKIIPKGRTSISVYKDVYCINTRHKKTLALGLG